MTMRIFPAWLVCMQSSDGCASCRQIAKKILDAYLEPGKSFVELRDMAKNGTIDLLYQFSVACREEFERLRAQHF